MSGSKLRPWGSGSDRGHGDAFQLRAIVNVQFYDDAIARVHYPDAVFDSHDAMCALVGQWNDVLHRPIAYADLAQCLAFERSQPEVAWLDVIVLDAVCAAAIGNRIAGDGLTALGVDSKDFAH